MVETRPRHHRRVRGAFVGNALWVACNAVNSSEFEIDVTVYGQTKSSLLADVVVVATTQ